MGRVVFERAGKERRGGDHQRDACDLEQAEQDQVGQDLVARALIDDSVDGQEGRAVGRLGPRPDRVGQRVERCRPEHVGPVGIRVDVMADHLALCGIGVDVPAEQRRCQQERHRPDRHDQHDALDRESLVASQVPEEADPDPGQEDEAAEHERQRGDGRPRVVRAERAEQPTRHPEEPCTREVGLERLATEDGPGDDRRRAQEAEERDPRHAEANRRFQRRAGCRGLWCSLGVGGSARGHELHRGIPNLNSHGRPPREQKSSSNCIDSVTDRGGTGNPGRSLTGFSGLSQPEGGNLGMSHA